MRVIGVKRRIKRPSRHRFYRSIAFGFVIGLVSLFLVWFVLPQTNPTPQINDSIRDSYNSACRVTVQHLLGESRGSGVLLDTGFVLTAGHNVDLNMNGVLEESERDVKLEFFSPDGTAYSCKARTVMMGKAPHYDFALLQPDHDLRSNVKFDTTLPLVGDRIHTIGCPRGLALHVTTGLQSVPTNKSRARASFGVYMGNSGGGVFTESEEVVGVVVGVGIDWRDLQVVTPIRRRKKNGKVVLRFYIGDGRYMQTLPNWAEYVKSSDIYEALEEKNLGFTVITPVKKTDWMAYSDYYRMTAQIFCVLFAVFLFRKELFLRA